MRTLEQQLAQYAAYHQQRRNVATHFVGVPMLVAAVAALLARPRLDAAGLPLTPAALLTVLALLFYVRLDLRFGLAMAAWFAPNLWLGTRIAQSSTGVWLGAGVGLFVGGWIIQFVGHVLEGKKPAFVDDLVGLVVGPLFLVAEVAFALGLRPELHAAIARHLAAAPAPASQFESDARRPLG